MITGPSNSSTSWHALPMEAVLHELAVEPGDGLNSDEVERRRGVFGENALNEPPRRSTWLKFFDQFRSLLVGLLLGAAVLAGVVGDFKDSLVIALVVTFNAALGFLQEYRAERALAALKGMLAPHAKVRRNGERHEIPARLLVPGDILLLEAGDRVPADARVIEAHAVEVSESALTGESMALHKTAGPLVEDLPLAEQSNRVFMNTVVTRGRLEAVVTETGMRSEMGRIARLLDTGSSSPKRTHSITPLQAELDRLGQRLALLAGAVVLLFFAVGLLRGEELVKTAMTAIALAVAAIPEGLPAVVTVTLALGMHRMAQHHAIVKKLAAVETLGCTTVICTDKTGTLTQNRMSVRCVFYQWRFFDVEGAQPDDPTEGKGRGKPQYLRPRDGKLPPDFLPLFRPLALCSDAVRGAGVVQGDPTETALLQLATSCGEGMAAEELTGSAPRVAEIPFDSRYKFMATFHRDDGDGRIQVWVKGAPEAVLGRSALTDEASRAFQQAHDALASQAMRVLAVAGRSIPGDQFVPHGDLMAWVQNLDMVGLVGLMDPPRPEACQAIEECRQAGIRVMMVTGDHSATAAAIAADVGIPGEVHEGKDLEGRSPGELAELVQNTGVFARVAPEHKLQIVQALQARQQVVAMTGDGVNDAPALQAAHIGIAMGITGTDVSKEAATLILTDDNFSSIVQAVREGRTIYENIVKFVRFQLTTNMGAILAVVGAPLCGLPAPFTALQILWVNIIMDGPPAMTLGVEPPRSGLMKEPPRRSRVSILCGTRLAKIMLHGALMALGTLAVYAWSLAMLGEAKAMSMAFTTFVLFQAFSIFNARNETGSAFDRQFFSNAPLWLALAAILALQGVAIHWEPAQSLFDTVDLDGGQWGLCVAVASSTLVLEELRKFLFRRQSK